MTTIAQLAADYDLQSYEVLASLDLAGETTDATEIDSIDGWTEDEARRALDLLAEQATDRD